MVYSWVHFHHHISQGCIKFISSSSPSLLQTLTTTCDRKEALLPLQSSQTLGRIGRKKVKNHEETNNKALTKPSLQTHNSLNTMEEIIWS